VQKTPIYCSLSQALVLSEKRREKRATELAQTARTLQLEILAKSQAKKIAELEIAYADL
jgi:hypothetical protein